MVGKGGGVGEITTTAHREGAAVNPTHNIMDPVYTPWPKCSKSQPTWKEWILVADRVTQALYLLPVQPPIAIHVVCIEGNWE